MRTDPAPATPSVTSVDVRRLSRRVFSACLLAVCFLWALDYFVNYSEWTNIGAIPPLPAGGVPIVASKRNSCWRAHTSGLLTGARPEPMFHELYFSMYYLAQTLLPGHNITADDYRRTVLAQVGDDLFDGDLDNLVKYISKNKAAIAKAGRGAVA